MVLIIHSIRVIIFRDNLCCINKNKKINIIMTVIESEKYFYKIGTITYLHDKDKYSEDLTKMINSFKEINPKN